MTKSEYIGLLKKRGDLKLHEIASMTIANIGRIEPIKRVKSLHHVPRGYRNMPVDPEYIWHRFPIKNGISPTRIMCENIYESNSLFNSIMKCK